jgi:hypothetical protein
MTKRVDYKLKLAEMKLKKLDAENSAVALRAQIDGLRSRNLALRVCLENACSALRVGAEALDTRNARFTSMLMLRTAIENEPAASPVSQEGPQR